MVEVRVPATSANLGPGFDSLGLALTLYNTFRVEQIDRGLKISVLPDGRVPLATDKRNLVYRAIRRLFDETGRQCGGLRIVIENGVPLGRGLGSSSTAIVGGLLAANELCGHRLSQEELFALATELEGHPDNVAPAIFGGFTICYPVSSGYGVAVFAPAENLRPVLLIPNASLSTKKARGVLPEQVPMADAVFNVARSSLLTAALLSGRSELLREAMKDRLHQPHRAPLIPGLLEILRDVGERTGAGIALSGAGPSLLCIIERAVTEEFCDVVQRVLKEHNRDYRIEPSEFDSEGARVLDSSATR